VPISPSDLPRQMPVFPLAGVILLPGGELPLNIFEPRYRAMTADALAGDRFIGMVQPRDAVTDPVPGDTDLFPVGCAGRIAESRPTGHGYLISLTGVCRFHLVDELEGREGYRRMRVDYAAFADDLRAPAPIGDRARLLGAVQLFLGAKGIEADWQRLAHRSDVELVNALILATPFQPREKQALLEAVSLPERAEMLAELFEMAAHEGPDGASSDPN
jgi:Lon protease-like protein